MGTKLFTGTNDINAKSVCHDSLYDKRRTFGNTTFLRNRLETIISIAVKSRKCTWSFSYLLQYLIIMFHVGSVISGIMTVTSLGEEGAGRFAGRLLVCRQFVVWKILSRDMRTTKTHISLHIRAVRSAPLLFAA